MACDFCPLFKPRVAKIMKPFPFVFLIVFMTTGCGLMSALREKRDFETIGIEANMGGSRTMLRIAFKELDACLSKIEGGGTFRNAELAGELKIENGYLFISTIAFTGIDQIPEDAKNCLSKAKNACGLGKGVLYARLQDRFPSLGGMPACELVSRTVLRNLQKCLEKENLNVTSMIRGKLKTVDGYMIVSELVAVDKPKEENHCFIEAAKSYKRDDSDTLYGKYDPVHTQYVYELEAHVYPSISGRIWSQEKTDVIEEF